MTITITAFERSPDGKRVEENGVKCFRGNILSPHQSSYLGFEQSLRDRMKTHDPTQSITAETSRCQWHGESMDYGQAIEAMRFLEHKAAAGG